MKKDRPREPSDFLPLSPVQYCILSSLAAESKHGYQIIRDIELTTDGRIRLGVPSLYENLGRLLDDGLIEPADDKTIERGERRKTYRLSGAGVSVLRLEDETRDRLILRNRGAFAW